MKAIIIEDEPIARKNLCRLLERNFPDIEVVGYATSVDEAVDLIRRQPSDIIFMDVLLSDGTCFDIFVQVDVTCAVVMTTAYDQYVMQAFEHGSVDYLLKPVDLPDLRRAVARSMSRYPSEDSLRILGALSDEVQVKDGTIYRERFLVRLGGKIYPIKTTDLAIFYSEQKSTYLLTKDNSHYIVNPPLDEIMKQLDPRLFFRVSRSCIVSRDAIRQISPLPGGRYRLKVEPEVPFDVEVSRGRSDDFYIWEKWS